MAILMTRNVSKSDGIYCPICSSVKGHKEYDYCQYSKTDEGHTIYICHRCTDSCKGDTIAVEGNVYRCLGVTSQGNTRWMLETEYSEEISEWKRLNGITGKSKTSKENNSRPVVLQNKEELPVEGVSELAAVARRDEVYRAFLNLLVLEDKHVEKLKTEWDVEISGVNIYDDIMKRWPIKSLPPVDQIRYRSKEPFKNEWRKKIMEKLVASVGEPVGVPLFYEREYDHTWTFNKQAGILYPTFNSYGQITSLRVNEDYPSVDGIFDGKEGQFKYLVPKDDKEPSGWYFIPFVNERPNYYNSKLVWEYGSSNNLISLNKKGYPDGKVNGKYKNLTSYYPKDIRDEKGNVIKRVNAFPKGCQSGSHLSLYTSDGDDPCMVYITEGEKKAIVANRILKNPVISLPGISSYGKLFEKEEGYDKSIIERLTEKGLSLSVLVFDSDKTTNKMVLDSEKKACKEFYKRGFPISIGEFNPIWGKGLDDILLDGVRFKIIKIG